MKRLASLFVAAAASVAWMPTAAAQPADQGVRAAEPGRDKTPVRNDVAPIIMAGWAEGGSGGLQLDGSIFALRSSFGYLPLVARVGETADGEPRYFDALHSYQVNADAILFFWAPTAYSRIGLSGGYRYNSVLGQGGSWGIQAEADVAEHATLVLSASTAYYPEGPGRARDALGNPDGPVRFVSGARFLSGVGLGVRFPI